MEDSAKVNDNKSTLKNIADMLKTNATKFSDSIKQTMENMNTKETSTVEKKQIDVVESNNVKESTGSVSGGKRKKTKKTNKMGKTNKKRNTYKKRGTNKDRK